MREREQQVNAEAATPKELQDKNVDECDVTDRLANRSIGLDIRMSHTPGMQVVKSVVLEQAGLHFATNYATQILLLM